METDIDLCIPVSAIFDEFVCPICLEAITDCYITPCGHNGCNECLSEWISRQHSCPVCVAPNITIPKLVKNLSFDNIYLRICEERRKAAAKYFKNLAATSAGDSATTLTPIEAVFQKHMHASLAGYKSGIIRIL